MEHSSRNKLKYKDFERLILQTFSINNYFTNKELLLLYCQYLNQDDTTARFLKSLTKYYSRKRQVKR